MFRKILVPLDGSPLAESILPEIACLAHGEGAELILLRAVPPTDLPRWGTAAEQYIAALSRELEPRYARVLGLVRQGEPAGAIVDTADEHRCDLIAMTTHGYGGLNRWIYGGVAERVVRHSPIPVLAMTARDPGESPARIRRVLVPLDGSPASEKILPHAFEAAARFGAQVVLMQVLPPGTESDDPRWKAAKRYLDQVAALFPDEANRVSLTLGRGDAATEIVRYVQDNHIDLVALTTHGQSGGSMWRLGEVSEKVLSTIHRPILLARAAGPVRAVARGA